jgi:predicted nucleotidyltransferase
MGIRPDKLAELLFGKTRARLLALLFGHPERSYYLSELFQLAGAGRGAVQRELARLESVGLVTVSRQGNQKRFQANAEVPSFAELEGLVRKTAGIAGTLAKALEPVRDRIRCAFVFGSVAKGRAGPHSDLDLFVVTDVSFERVVHLLMSTHDQIGREINPIVLTEREFAAKVAESDPFLKRILEQEKLFVYGTPHDLEELAQNRTAD